ncbi:MAG TPA: cobalamin-independent methionine synthase II family protein [Steroidobacteraceae bacterium]
MKRSEDRILTTHVGSLIRPAELLALAGERIGPPKDPVQYRKVLADCIDQVVAKQVACCIDIVNDGEYGKSNWANYIGARISGFQESRDKRSPMVWLGRDAERFPEVVEKEFPNFRQGFPAMCCVAPITYTDPEPIRTEIELLQHALRKVKAEEAFITVVAPASAMFVGINEYYATEREYIFALAEALRQEYLEVYNAGFIVQVDDAVLANMYDHLVQQSPEHYRKWAELRIEALNHALRGIPEDRVRYHVCFGSWHVPHMSDAPLEEIVDLILRVNAGAYSLEAANPRHEHEWRVWQKVKLPDGKILIPGVVTHHVVTVEHPQVVADRIVRFARAVGRENVIAGTDCGFAQVDHIQRVHEKVMWAKLEALAEGARLATRELWGR